MTVAGLKRINRGKGHTYVLDGKKPMGVTTAIGKGMPKPALPYWSARTVAEYVADLDDEKLHYLRSFGRDSMINVLKGIPWAQRDEAAVRGTDVHKLAEQLVRGDDVQVPEPLVGHVEAAASFMDDWQPRELLAERAVGHRRWMYAGTFDLVAELPDGRRILFDYKTSKSGIWPETALQLAAYRWAECYATDDGIEIPMSEVGITDAMAVWLRADGYDVVPLDTGPEVFKAFIYTLMVARASESMKGWVGDALEPPKRVAA